MPLTVTLKGKGEKVTIEAMEKTFSKGTKGYYFRDRVVIDGESHHVQLIVSKK
jgi:hypothetical protein